jgi:ribose-phosphate pyrophosphokinase
MSLQDLHVFAPRGSHAFGAEVARHLGLALSPLEERDFEDGEHKIRPLANVRNRDVFVVQSLCGDHEHSVNDKLCRLLFFIGALKDASAGLVTAVIPYLGYARKDRKTQPRDPVTTRYVAALFEAVGTDRVVTLDVHDLAAYQNAFRCRTDHLEAAKLFVAHFAAVLAGRQVAVVSPDVGGMKRAAAFRERLARALDADVPVGFMEKTRARGRVTGERLYAEVADRAAIIIDDLISTGTTVQRCARACRALGATAVHVAASHGVFVAAANRTLADPAIDSVVVTNTLRPFRIESAELRRKLLQLDASPLFAEAIARMHGGGSIVDLLRDADRGQGRRQQ